MEFVTNFVTGACYNKNKKRRTPFFAFPKGKANGDYRRPKKKERMYGKMGYVRPLPKGRPKYERLHKGIGGSEVFSLNKHSI